MGSTLGWSTVLQAIAQFLRLNARTAFALFAAGVFLWGLRRLEIVSRDPVELGVGYLAGFGLSDGARVHFRPSARSDEDCCGMHG